jgi:hypothetical protein
MPLSHKYFHRKGVSYSSVSCVLRAVLLLLFLHQCTLQCYASKEVDIDNQDDDLLNDGQRAKVYLYNI